MSLIGERRKQSLLGRAFPENLIYLKNILTRLTDSLINLIDLCRLIYRYYSSRDYKSRVV
jgi:hypothetical protein